MADVFGPAVAIARGSTGTSADKDAVVMLLEGQPARRNSAVKATDRNKAMRERVSPLPSPPPSPPFILTHHPHLC